GDTIWDGTSASLEDVDAAVREARKAFPAWARRSCAERQSMVEAFGEQLKAHREELAELIGRETGKPLWESLTEVDAMLG
ncbi:N-succinylglutamate 5-semialdehyde dehydrogenase, partial [Enterococcus hirae]